MLKKSFSFVLTRHSRLTISAAFTNVPRLIQRGVNVAPVRRRDAHYSSRRGPRCGLPVERRVLARWGWAGENEGLFEHPADHSERLSPDGVTTEGIPQGRQHLFRE